MDKVKSYLEKFLKILNLKELKILPAYLSYNFVLAIIPLLTIIVIVAGAFSISLDTIIDLIEKFLPTYVSNYIIEAISGKEFDISVGFLNLATFFIATNGTYAIIDASNSLYKVEKTSFVKDRLKSVLMLFLIIGLLLFLILVPMLGDKILATLGNYKLFSNILDEIILIYKIVRWPITFLMIFFNIKLIYIIAPSINVKREDTTIGALVTTISWVIFTAIFGYYIKYFAKYDLIYGGLSSIIILLIWIYVLSFILLLGIVINTNKYNKI